MEVVCACTHASMHGDGWIDGLEAMHVLLYVRTCVRMSACMHACVCAWMYVNPSLFNRRCDITSQKAALDSKLQKSSRRLNPVTPKHHAAECRIAAAPFPEVESGPAA